jgi:DNA-binding PadR family transcriptional regulator
MIGDWIQRVGSSIPRGFSRFFILELLKKKSYTGKQIIDSAIKQSGGKWKPSPGLIYPLLGRLLDDGLISEDKDGKCRITKKGRKTTDDLQTINEIVKNQLDVLFRLGSVGRFVILDMLERLSVIGSLLSENAAQMTKEEIKKYEKFLKSELDKMEKMSNEREQKIKID